MSALTEGDVLIDTNVLMALCEPKDGLYHQAASVLRTLSGRRLFTTPAVLTEAVHGLSGAYQRLKASDITRRTPYSPAPVGS